MTKIVHNVEKVTKNDLTIISIPHTHPHTIRKTHAKFQNDRYKTVRSVAFKRGTLCLYIQCEKWLSSQCGKSDKNDLTITSKRHVHPYIMKKTHAKVQNDRYKTVRGVVLTRGTHCLYIYYILRVKNDFTMWKSDKKWSNNYIQTTCTSSYHEKTQAVSKRLVQNCKRSCAHKTPRVNGDGWTDERTEKKAGATKIMLF